MKIIGKYLIGTLIFGGIILFVSTITSPAPDNAIVIVDTRTNTYFPQIYEANNDEFRKISTYKMVKQSGLKPKNGFDDFWQERRLIFEILNLNIWRHPRTGDSHFESRWNDDGSWNW